MITPVRRRAGGTAGRDRAMRYSLLAMGRPWDAIVWWEIRRIPFNLIILAAGIVSLATIELVGSYVVEPGDDAVEPLLIWFGVMAYGLAANVCYTLGWLTEILWTWGDTTLTEA